MRSDAFKQWIGKALLVGILVLGGAFDAAAAEKTKKRKPRVVGTYTLDFSSDAKKPKVTFKKSEIFRSKKSKKKLKYTPKKTTEKSMRGDVIPVGDVVVLKMTSTGFAGGVMKNPRLIADPVYAITSSTCHSSSVPCETYISFTPTDPGFFSGTYYIDFEVSTPPHQIITYSVSFDNAAYKDIPPPECSKKLKGSIIQVDSKGLIEQVPIVGTDFSLVYSSIFMPDYYTSYPNVDILNSFNPEGWSVSINHHLDAASGRLFLGTGFVSLVSPITSGVNKLVVYGEDVFVFDSSGKHLSTKSTLTGYDKYTFSYNGSSKLILITDAFGNETEFDRDLSGNLQMVTSPKGAETTITVNPDGLISEITDPESKTYEAWYYDDSTLLESFIKPSGHETLFEYTVSGTLFFHEGPAGNFWDWLIEGNGDAQDITRLSALGREQFMTLAQDPITLEYGRAITEPSGLETHYYEHPDKSSGNSNVFESSVKTTQNDVRFGSAKKVLDSYTEVIDSLTRVTSVTEVATLSVPSDPYSYTTIQATTSVNGNNTVSTFNKSTKTMTTVDPSSVTTVTQLNTQEQPVSIQLGGDTATTLSYNGEGRLTQTIQGVKNQTVYTYNAEGWVQKITNGLSQETSFTYDNAGRVLTKTLPDTRVITYEYNDDGVLTGITPPGRPKHEYVYNLMDLVSSYTPPTLVLVPNPETSYTYNDDKQLTVITRPDSKTVNFNYHATTGLLTSKAHDGGSETYTYESNSDVIKTVTSIDGVLSEYVPFGLSDIKSEKQTKSSSVTEVHFTRNNLFNITNRLLKYNTVTVGNTSYTYRANGQITDAGAMQITYNAEGRVATVVLDNIEEDYTYDTYGQLQSYTSEYTGIPTVQLYSYTLTRDSLHRITAKSETVLGTTTSYAYTYDSAGRLSTMTVSGDVYDYIYDSNSNRTTVKKNSVTILSATYDNQDRVLTADGWTYTHNANGELTSKTDGVTTIDYESDSLGRLKGIYYPAKEIEYTLDWRGRRFERIKDTVATTRYLYEDELKLAGERNISSGVVSEYVYALSHSPDMMKEGGTEYKLIKDHLGSVRLVVNASTGVVVQRLDYDVWGKVTNDTNPGRQSFGFAGGIYESETGLVRFGARNYDAETGRWLSKDPILFAGRDPNLYGYVLNDPVNFIDYDGEFAVPAFLGGLAIVDAAVGAGLLVTAVTLTAKLLDDLSKMLSQNIKDTGMRDLTDADISNKARDKKISPQERRKYQKEEKARGLRNKQKRKDRSLIYDEDDDGAEKYENCEKNIWDKKFVYNKGTEDKIIYA